MSRLRVMRKMALRVFRHDPRQAGAHGVLRILLPGILALALTGCAATDAHRPDAPGPAAQGAALGDTQLVQTAAAPLNDLNLVRDEIPAVLAAAQKAPYAEPADGSCAALAGEIRALDAALGADLDAPTSPANPGLVEQGVEVVGQVAAGTVRGAVNGVVDGVVPFRTWVRKLSGAERHSGEMAAAKAAGTLRRAFLKGWGQAAKCAVPVAQRP